MTKNQAIAQRIATREIQVKERAKERERCLDRAAAAERAGDMHGFEDLQYAADQHYDEIVILNHVLTGLWEAVDAMNAREQITKLVKKDVEKYIESTGLGA